MGHNSTNSTGQTPATLGSAECAAAAARGGLLATPPQRESPAVTAGITRDASNLSLHVAVPTDLAAVRALIESAYRGDSSRTGWTTEAHLLDGQRTDVVELGEVIASPIAELLLARDGDGLLLGCCQLAHRGNGLGYFGMFAVRPHRQGGGVGSWLLAAAERRALAQGARVIEMTVIAQREDLIAWYGRRGYAPTGQTRPFPYGEPRFGLPRRTDLFFAVLVKRLA